MLTVRGYQILSQFVLGNFVTASGCWCWCRDCSTTTEGVHFRSILSSYGSSMRCTEGTKSYITRGGSSPRISLVTEELSQSTFRLIGKHWFSKYLLTLWSKATPRYFLSRGSHPHEPHQVNYLTEGNGYVCGVDPTICIQHILRKVL